MFEFIGGLALGAIAAPFWMMLWEQFKVRVVALLSKKEE